MLLKNVAWLAAERVAVAAILLTSNVYVVRYLGPQSYGALAFFQAVLAVFMATSEFGVRRILVVLKSVRNLSFIYSQAMRLKAMVAFAMATVLCLILLFGNYPKYNWIIMLFILASPLEVYCYYFEATLNNRPLAIARAAFATVAATLRIILCTLEAPIPLIALTFVIPPVATVLVVRRIAICGGFRIQVSSGTKRSRTALRAIASRGMYFWLSIVLIQLGMRADVFILTWLSGAAETGVYSAAQKLFEQGISMFAIVGVVSLPYISKRKKTGWPTDLQNLYTMVFLGAVVICIPLFIFSDTIIGVLYGSAYLASADVFRILAIALPFMLLANISGLFYSAYRIERFAFMRNLFALLLAVCLQIFLIPKYQAAGAAFSILVTQFFLSLVFEMVHPACRPNAIIKWKGIIGLFSLDFYSTMLRGVKNDFKTLR